MKFLASILSFLNFCSSSFTSPFFTAPAQERSKTPSTYSTHDVLNIKNDASLLESFIVEILKINNPQDRWNKLLFLIDNNIQLMPDIKEHRSLIKSDFLNDSFVKEFSKEFSQRIYRILQSPTQEQEALLKLRPFQGFNQYLDVAQKKLTDFQKNTSPFKENNEKYRLQEEIFLEAKAFQNSSWYFDAEILNVLVNGSEKQFLKIPVMPDGACVYHALGIDPDATFFQSLIENILKIEDSKARWNTLLSLIDNQRANLPGVNLRSYRETVKNNFEENLVFKKNFTQKFAQEIANSLKNAYSVDEKMKYTLNMADKNIQNTLEKTLDKKIETFALRKESDKLQIKFRHDDSFKIVLYKNHWCPIFDKGATIPLRYLKKETLDKLRTCKSDSALLQDSPVE